MPTSLLKNKPPGRVLAQPGACLYAPLAQLVEQLTLNQWVLGSSPRWCTTNSLTVSVGLFFYCLFRKGTTWCTIGDENSSRPAARPAGQKQSCGLFLERGRVPDALKEPAVKCGFFFYCLFGEGYGFLCTRISKLKEKGGVKTPPYDIEENEWLKILGGRAF